MVLADVIVFLADGTFKVLVGEEHVEGPNLDTVWKPILMQFTGLLDKNGNEIYEGDIVKIPDERIEQVIWSIDCQSHAGHGDSSTNVCAGFNISGYGNFKPDEFEVLGNIYENADLLK